MDDIIRLAETRGGAFISPKYDGEDHRAEWQCAKGHKWFAKVFHVRRGHWCPKCAGKAPVTMDDVAQVLKNRPGGECLSTEILGSKQRLDWRCVAGHEWKATYNSVSQGNWCATCSRSGSSLGERITRAVLSRMFGASFQKERPKWLPGKGTSRMELDGFAESLNLAFEYHGRQHYEAVPGFSAGAVAGIKERDERKSRVCQERGIRLIVVPEFRDPRNISGCIDQIEHAVLWSRLAIPRNWKRPKELPEVYDPLESVLGVARVAALQAMAAQRGGELLSGAIGRAEDPLTWRCAANHTWYGSAKRVLKTGLWCQQCNREQGSARRLKQAATKGHTLETMRSVAASRGGACLSPTYLGRGVKLLWECAAGHQWSAIPHNVRRGAWCRECDTLARRGQPRGTRRRCEAIAA